MSFLARADKRAIVFGVVGSLVLSIAGAFWALPHIEDELEEESLSVASYVDSPGFEVEWNGRDGYLTVPAGTSRSDAERVAADLADIDGARDVEIRSVDLSAAVIVEEEAPAEEEPPVETTVAVVDEPASFTVQWDDGGVIQTGNAPDTVGDDIALLGVEAPLLGDRLTVDEDVAGDLAALAPLIGTFLVSGTATVDNGDLSIVALARSATDLEAAQAVLADAGADDIVIELAPDAAADGDDAAEPDVDVQAALDALDLSGVKFQTNTSLLTTDAELVVDEIADVLRANPSIAIDITGHTDSRGPDAANQLLSEARARAVLEGLVSRGIERERLTATGVGETEPIATNDTLAGQEENRRVEIKIKETN